MLFPGGALTNPHMPGVSHEEITLIEARGQGVPRASWASFPPKALRKDLAGLSSSWWPLSPL